MQRINRIIDLIFKGMLYLAGILIIFLMLSITLGIVMRLMGRPLIWVIELNEYVLLYITFLVGPWVLRKDAHVRVDIVLNWVSPRIQTVLMVLNSLVGLCVSLLITFYGARVSLDLLLRGVYNPTLLSFPKGPLVAIIPIGFLLLSVQFLYQIINSWTKLKTEWVAPQISPEVTEVP
ncbi:MAG: TRAP transporter small permease [Carboxydocellales bacterium]